MSAPEFSTMHKEDAVGYFRCCSDRFGELAALFDAIRRLAAGPFSSADCWREDLDKGGFR